MRDSTTGARTRSEEHEEHEHDTHPSKLAAAADRYGTNEESEGVAPRSLMVESVAYSGLILTPSFLMFVTLLVMDVTLRPMFF